MKRKQNENEKKILEHNIEPKPKQIKWNLIEPNAFYDQKSFKSTTSFSIKSIIKINVKEIFQIETRTQDGVNSEQT